MSAEAPVPLHYRKRWRHAPRPPALTGVELRQLQAADEEGLGRLFWLAFSSNRSDAFPGPEQAAHDAAETLAGRWGPLIAPASNVVVVGEEIVGAAVVVHDSAHDGTPLLAYVATLPAFRGRGIAAHLIAMAEAALTACGLCELHLAVVEDNPARRLYERLGYVLVGADLPGD